MIVLAIDLTSEYGSLAVRANGVTVAELGSHSPEGFGHLIIPAVEEVLALAGVRLEQVDCFAGASGPGSFTGVRVGLATVKGLAEALGKPAAGVSNLRAMSSFGTLENRAVILDARRGDIYAAVYNRELHLVSPEVVTKLPDWLPTLTLTEYEFIVQADSAFRSTLNATEAPRNLAAAVAQCAAEDGKHGLWSDPAALDANYVRRADAALSWKESQP